MKGYVTKPKVGNMERCNALTIRHGYKSQRSHKFKRVSRYLDTLFHAIVFRISLFRPYHLHVLIVGYVLTAHAFQVRSLKLAVDEVAAAVFHQVGQIDECEL